MTRYCAHCDLAPTDGKRRHCRACREYKRRNGHLPPASILRRRVELADLRRFEREAWGAA